MNTLTAFYDLAVGPVSYDFVTWLVRAKFEAQERGFDRLHVVIVPKEGGFAGFARHWGEHDEAATRWRLWHIVIASCPLADATVTLASSVEQARRIQVNPDSEWWPIGKAHFMGPLVEAARAGKAIPRLKATAQAKHYIREAMSGLRRQIVTLTLRNQTTDPARNSDESQWRQLSDWFALRGYDVVTLDDSHRALGSGRGFAELDPDLRLALYEQAVLNVIGNNGPQELLKFSDAPYVAMGQALTAGWQEHFRKYFSMAVGDQLPWAHPKQRLVYRPDTFHNMRESLEDLV